MKVIRNGESAGHTGTTFTGEVRLESLHASQEGGVGLSLVRFEDGARTYWHVHPGEQLLYILEGAGRVGNGEEQFEVRAGDVVYTPPGERHWHGALPGHSMAHLSITNVGSP